MGAIFFKTITKKIAETNFEYFYFEKKKEIVTLKLDTLFRDWQVIKIARHSFRVLKGSCVVRRFLVIIFPTSETHNSVIETLVSVRVDWDTTRVGRVDWNMRGNMTLQLFLIILFIMPELIIIMCLFQCNTQVNNYYPRASWLYRGKF